VKARSSVPGIGSALLTIAVLMLALWIAPAVAAGDPIPLPAGANATVNANIESVSCPSAGACSAAGSYFDSTGKYEVLLLDQTDGAWKATEGDVSAIAALPGGIQAVHAGLFPESISCASAQNCTAVGFYEPLVYSYEPLVLTETAGSWSAAGTLTGPSGGDATPDNELKSVSCSSPGNCSAVGYYKNTSGYYEGMTATETNGSWGAAVAAPLPSGFNTNPNVTLYSVACTSPGDCVADGTYETSGGAYEALILTQTNGTWTAAAASLSGLSIASATIPDVTISDVSENGADSTLACPAAGSCVAVGQYTDTHGAVEGMLLTQSASAWSAHTLDLSKLSDAEETASGNPDPDVVLGSVSCVSAGNCSAAGNYQDHSGYQVGFVVNEVNGVWQPATTVPAARCRPGWPARRPAIARRAFCTTTTQLRFLRLRICSTRALGPPGQPTAWLFPASTPRS
jgi:hypothetical protein